jgi:UDP-N-acetylmuramate--alanine ligase
MSALARWFRHYGCTVAGYDRTPTSLTDALAAEGISVHFDDAVSLIPPPFRAASDSVLVVYTPAIPAGHQELEYFRTGGFTLLKRSQVLGMLTQNLYTVAVAGTHGKTTTSSMIAHVLTEGGRNCTAFLGGITQNYNTNLLLGNAGAGAPVMVAEADEYDRSFLTLFPDVAVVTSMDADHLDIYGTHDELKKSFRDFVAQIKPGGRLFRREGLPLAPAVETTDFALEGSSGYVARNVRQQGHTFLFDVATPAGNLEGFSLQMPGFHNVENATAATAVALHLGLEAAVIKNAIASFRGVKRRFEYVLVNDRHVFIDDYAHHPTEIEAFLRSVRALYPERHVTAVFQPHLYSRTRDFADGFARSLELADRLLLLEIYPARELPMPGVTSEIIFEKTNLADKALCPKGELLGRLQQIPLDVLVTIGAGDIDKYVRPIRDWLAAEAGPSREKS